MKTCFCFVPVIRSSENSPLYKLDWLHRSPFCPTATELWDKWTPLKPAIRILIMADIPGIPNLHRKIFGFEGQLFASRGDAAAGTAREEPLYFCLVARSCTLISPKVWDVVNMPRCGGLE